MPRYLDNSPLPFYGIDPDDEVGCWEDDRGEQHHGIACDHPTCSDCGAILVDEECTADCAERA